MFQATKIIISCFNITGNDNLLRRKVIPANVGRREEVSVLMSLYNAERQLADVDLRI